jgi:hypothetical protein
MQSTHSDLKEKLTGAYNRMLEHAKQSLEKAAQGSLPSLKQLIDGAKKTAVELEELTIEEAELIGGYLRRDLHDAAQRTEERGHELAEWLRFDIELVEERLAEVFSHLVDHTRLELDQLAEEAKHHEWNTGDVTTLGSLVCGQCGHELHFHATARIPACPKCQGTRFHRSET